MPSPPHRRWVILRETRSITWGGDLRRFHLLEELATRTGAASIQGWTRPSIRAGIRASGGLPLPIRVGWGPRPVLASTEFLTPGAVVLAKRHYDLQVLDVHDHPVAQAVALGRPHADDHRRALEQRIRMNLDAFPIHLAPSSSFAELAGLDSGRTIVAPNGTDTRHVVPGPLPQVPRIGFVSGAAPGRGIELLLEAARGLRAAVPDLRLALWLAGGDPIGEAYIDGIRADTCGDDWIEVASVPYASLGAALATAAVLVVPHPPNAYLDSAVPVKLLDSMAAGRPVVVTPRHETRLIVERWDSGRVAAGDSADDLAAAILPLLTDPATAQRLGANGRRAAEAEFDWRVIGGHVADAVLERVRGER
jgi:glycosyltransferase involved in cell wall biosynthesis